MFSLSKNLGFHGPPLLTFKTDRLDFRGLDLLQPVNAAQLSYMQDTRLKVSKLEAPVLHINLGACTYTAFLN